MIETIYRGSMQGLAAVHGVGLLHGDLHAGNIMMVLGPPLLPSFPLPTSPIDFPVPPRLKASSERTERTEPPSEPNEQTEEPSRANQTHQTKTCLSQFYAQYVWRAHYATCTTYVSSKWPMPTNTGQARGTYVLGGSTHPDWSNRRNAL